MCVIDWELMLGFLKVFLSWPVVTLILGLIFIFIFKGQISNLLGRVTEGDVYGMKFKASTLQDSASGTKLEPVRLSNDQIKWISDNPDKAFEEYTKVFNFYRWERAMNFIYGTQIDLLESLSNKADLGELYVNLGYFHVEHQRRAGSTAYQMSDYLNFLVQQGFIVSEGVNSNLKIKISPDGLNFLSYIKSAYPDAWNKKSF